MCLDLYERITKRPCPAHRLTQKAAFRNLENVRRRGSYNTSDTLHVLLVLQCPSCNAETVHHTALTKSKANSLTAAAVKGRGRVGEHPRDRNESRSCNAMLAGDGVVQVIASMCENHNKMLETKCIGYVEQQ